MTSNDLKVISVNALFSVYSISAQFHQSSFSTGRIGQIRYVFKKKEKKFNKFSLTKRKNMLWSYTRPQCNK